MGKSKENQQAREDATVSAVGETPAAAATSPATDTIAVVTAKDVPSANEIPLAPELPKAESPAVDITPVAAQAGEPKLDTLTLSETDAKASAPKDTAPAEKIAGTPATDALPTRSRRFALLAASIALLAALGAFAGSLGATGIARLMPASPDATTISKATDTDTQRVLKALAADVAALKASLDAGGRNANAQFAKIADRLDRIERRAAGTAAGTTAAAETTGSVATARTATAAEPRLPPTPPVAEKQPIDGWVLRDIYDGRALVESRYGGLYEIGPGTNLPGVGRVETIKRQDGRWIVVTSRGIIASYR